MRKTICSVIITFTLLSLGLAPRAQAVNPPPDGGYPGGNTAAGQNALLSLSTGAYNTAVGFLSLLSNAEGRFNTAIGAGALLANTGEDPTGAGAGSQNTATGAGTLLNSTGGFNTANGAFALFNNTTGASNNAIGDHALFQNTTGLLNVAIGSSALTNNTSGSSNIAIGVNAGVNLTTSDNNIAIGNEGDANDSDTIRIGNASHGSIFVLAIKNIVLGAGMPVTIDSTTGLLGIATSSLRFKQNIKPMDKSSEAILALKPVTFRYNQKIDPKAIAQFGLIAEDVEKVSPDLVVRDKEGKPYSVRYDQVKAMLLNEFLKEHRRVEALQASFAQQQKDFQATVAEQQKQIEALTAGLQRVSEQVEKSKVAPKLVSNP